VPRAGAPRIACRFLYRQSIETARCVHEGVLRGTAEANIGSILGIGFPAWTGGAMQFIKSEGGRFWRRAGELAVKRGECFAVSSDLRKAIAATLH
jgi:3-hydroxyacyl-CoA dehydrogenase/enoyl-CoA hydratase/3-hydroxybutyryl-CoA epimerase